MATIQTLYATLSAGVLVSASVTSLGNGNSWISQIVDNSVNLYLDALVVYQLIGQASGTNTVDLFVVGSFDGTDVTDNGTGDATISSAAVLNARPLGSIRMNTTTTVVGGPFSVAQAFGGWLPNKWGIVITNNSGAALATGGPLRLKYQGIKASVV